MIQQGHPALTVSGTVSDEAIAILAPLIACAEFVHVHVRVMARPVDAFADDEEHARGIAFVDQAMAVAVVLGKGRNVPRAHRRAARNRPPAPRARTGSPEFRPHFHASAAAPTTRRACSTTWLAPKSVRPVAGARRRYHRSSTTSARCGGYPVALVGAMACRSTLGIQRC